MKAMFLTLAMILVSSIMGVSAQNLIYTNTCKTESETVKECIAYNSDEDRPDTKTIYTYNKNGDMVSKVVSKWTEGEWLIRSKSEFSYDDAKLSVVTHTKWDNRINNWANESQYTNFLYDDNGDFLTAVDSKGNSENLVTAR